MISGELASQNVPAFCICTLAGRLLIQLYTNNPDGNSAVRGPTKYCLLSTAKKAINTTIAILRTVEAICAYHIQTGLALPTKSLTSAAILGTCPNFLSWVSHQVFFCSWKLSWRIFMSGSLRQWEHVHSGQEWYSILSCTLSAYHLYLCPRLPPCNHFCIWGHSLPCSSGSWRW